MRNLSIKDPKTGNMAYGIITYSGGLVFRGDMGCYVFERTHDMFNFFRSEELQINPHYQAEKCQSESVYGKGIREFSYERFCENVKHHFDMMTESESQDDKDAIWTEIEEQIFEMAEESEWDCAAKISDFTSTYAFDFTDFWEDTCQIKTYHFIWCLYAIQHAINLYDKEMERLESEEVEKEQKQSKFTEVDIPLSDYR
jgi:hypothetical protein